MAYLPFNKIKYEGPKSTNPLAFKYYDANRVVMGKKMKDHLRFSLCYWHTFESVGQDQFGEPTRRFKWDNLDPMGRARMKVEVAFEYFQKMGVEYFAFHDRDIAPETGTLEEYFKNVEEIVGLIKAKMAETGIKLLWNTSNLFSHPRFAAGAGSATQFEIFTVAAAITKHNLEIGKKLGAMNFVFWGGREGYETLLNTKMAQEQKQVAELIKMARAYADEIGFKAQFMIEPKAKEPTTHQYDFDTAAVLNFMKTYGLEKILKLNLEQNHALLAGHTFQHELRTAREAGFLGSLDSNEGDPMLGWDTDQFPYNIRESTFAMYEILKNGGIAPGGLNFDSKLRRQSNDLTDFAYGTILGMDVYAKGLLAAAKIIEDGTLDKFTEERYATWTKGLGKKVLEGKATLAEVAELGPKNGGVKINSGRQEMLESIVNQAILEAK